MDILIYFILVMLAVALFLGLVVGLLFISSPIDKIDTEEGYGQWMGKDIEEDS